MSDRSDERREGYVPNGRRGWRKTDGTTRMEIQPVTPGWALALRQQQEKKDNE